MEMEYEMLKVLQDELRNSKLRISELEYDVSKLKQVVEYLQIKLQSKMQDTN